MGLESRDYVRDNPPPGGYGYGGGGRFGSGSGYWAVKFLLIANILVFILQVGTGRVIGDSVNGGITEWLALKMAGETREEVKFREVKIHQGGVPPSRLDGKIASVSNTVEMLPAGTGVERIAEYSGDVTFVRVGDRFGIIPAGSIKPAPLKSWQWSWRILTSGFCHANLWHIAFNMFVLFTFGRLLEPILGSKEFLITFLAGVVVSGICHEALQIMLGTNIAALGASGGVMTIVFITAMTFPDVKVLLFFVIPMDLRIAAILLVAIDVLGLLGIFQLFGANIAHAAHLGGAAFGVAYKYFGWRFSGFFSNWSNPLKRVRRKPKLRVHAPDDEPPARRVDDMEAKVDQLLAKISAEGEAALTDEEREFLAEASRRYRGR